MLSSEQEMVEEHSGAKREEDRLCMSRANSRSNGGALPVPLPKPATSPTCTWVIVTTRSNLTCRDQARIKDEKQGHTIFTIASVECW